MMLLDYFGVFGWTSGKMDEISKFWQFWDPTQQHKSTPRRRPTPQRSTVHIHVFLSCFVISLFRGLVYWTNEDPI